MTDTPLELACPHCQALNRVPASRLGSSPNCGRCHQQLFLGKPLALTATDFDRHALRSQLPLLGKPSSRSQRASPSAASQP